MLMNKYIMDYINTLMFILISWVLSYLFRAIISSSLELERDIISSLTAKFENEVDTGSLLLTAVGIPKLVEYGCVSEYKYYMVMSLHGDKVDSMKKECGGKIDHNQVIEIAQQVIRWLQKLHSIGYVHWDIKPHNILFSTSDEDQFDEDDEQTDAKYTLIDFGICSKYLDENGNHIK